MKNKELTFQSTRSNKSPDEYRDMTGFNVDDELRRLNTMCSILQQKKESLPGDFKFVLEAIKNIDEHLYRCGELPDRWEKATTKKKLKKV